MLVHILGDIHNDRNKDSFESKKKDLFTICTGDISNNPNKVVKWIKENISEGLFVCGNHEFSNNIPMPEIYKYFKNEFPLNNKVSFLQNSYKIIDNKVFVGCTLWTDFSLSIKGKINSIKRQKLENYIYGFYRDWEMLAPFHTIKEFKVSLNYLQYICKKFIDKEIIVITHHCPSMKCSAPKYTNNILNSAMITDLEDFIIMNPNIKYWFCGHCHREPLDIKIGQCRLIMNTKGYIKEGLGFNPELTIEI